MTASKRAAFVPLALALLGPFSFSAAMAASPPAAAQQVVSQGADVYRLRIGSVPVFALSDGSVPMDLHQLLQHTTPARTDALLQRNFQANPAEASINAYLVQLPGRLVLIDTGSGELFGPGAGGGLIASLERAGFEPGQVTDILITHAHSDHSGGLVRGGRRVFENAMVHVGKPDLDFFFDATAQQRTGYDQQYFDVAATTLKPYLDAGKVSPIAADGEVVPGISATLHAGHTPGSAFFTLSDGGENLVFVGDLVHSTAVQFPEPAVTIAYDQDSAGAARVRAEAFDVFAREGTLVAVPHAAFPGIGHVRREADGYAWVGVTYTNRGPN
ncbi:MBL fold metallo-hydrolase [Brevundimonas sp.]|uniref:MBL fold metallo-hydrolase n=1 Tax=Brevundimonas sp. TaxID=1871086 RepID=UPI00356554F3